MCCYGGRLLRGWGLVLWVGFVGVVVEEVIWENWGFVLWVGFVLVLLVGNILGKKKGGKQEGWEELIIVGEVFEELESKHLNTCLRFFT